MDCKLKDGDPLSPHVIKMIGYVQALDRLGFPLLDELATDVVLGSLPPSYGTFISNYHMHGMDKKLTELHGMLKVVDQDIKKGTHQVLMVQKSAKFKKSWSKKKAKAKGTETVTSAVAPKSGPDSKTVCFHCKETGHWKRNYSKWLAEHGKKAGNASSGKGTLVAYVIDIYLADIPSSSWVFDTRSVVHICNSMQGLVRTRRVAQGEIDIRVGNKARVAALEVGTMQLQLPSGFILELNNCYYIPALSRNIISASCLMSQGYEFNLKDNGCSIYLNEMFHGYAPIVDGLFILNLEGSWSCIVPTSNATTLALLPTLMSISPCATRLVLTSPLHRVANMNNRSGIKYPRATRYVSKVNVYNICNKCTFAFPAFLPCSTSHLL